MSVYSSKSGEKKVLKGGRGGGWREEMGGGGRARDWHSAWKQPVKNSPGMRTAQ